MIFGRCTKCTPGEGSYGSLTISDILDDYLKPLNVPAWEGAQIGHIDRQFIMPLGVQAEIDADKGSIRLLEPAVVQMRSRQFAGRDAGECGFNVQLRSMSALTCSPTVVGSNGLKMTPRAPAASASCSAPSCVAP